MELYRILDEDMARFQPGRIAAGMRNAEDRAFLSLVIASPGAEAAILTLKDRDRCLLSFLLLQIRETVHSFELPRRYCLVMDFCVAPEARSQGLGGELLEAAKNWARERGAESLQLRVLSENSRAIAFYERPGLKESARTMECPL